MKITKQQLQQIIKEEVMNEFFKPFGLGAGGNKADSPSKSTDLDLARDAARPADPIGPQEAHALAKTLEGLGFAFTRGGMHKLEDFLAELEASEDLRRR